MIFDKQTYWKNRKAGKRGQGELPKFIVPEMPKREDGSWISPKRKAERKPILSAK